MRAQRLLKICDWKLTKLEKDPEALENMSIRDLRSLAKTIHDLQADLLQHAELATQDTSSDESKYSALEELFFDSARSHFPAQTSTSNETHTNTLIANDVYPAGPIHPFNTKK